MTQNSRRGAVAVVALLSSMALVAVTAGPALAAPPVPTTVMTCAKLAAATDPVAAFPMPVAQRYVPAQQEIHEGGIPFSDWNLMAGGISCEWSNGGAFEPFDTVTVGVRVEFLPGDAAGYWHYVGGATTDPEYLNCMPASECIFATSAGGDYFYGQVYGLDPAAGESLLRSMSAALQLGLQTPYVAPIYATPLHLSCSRIARPAVWRSAIGSPDPLMVTNLGGYDARTIVHGHFCSYANTSDTSSAGLLTSLPGGRWSFLLLRPLLTTPGPLVAATAPGMRSGDQAFTRCDPRHKHCILDVIIATHWIQVDLPRNSVGSTLIRNDRLEAAQRILEEIVTQVYAP